MKTEKMYETGGWGSELITSVDVDRYTTKSVWIGERRTARISGFRQYHETWKEAHNYLKIRTDAKLKQARLMLRRAHGEYRNIKGLKEF